MNEWMDGLKRKIKWVDDFVSVRLKKIEKCNEIYIEKERAFVAIAPLGKESKDVSLSLSLCVLIAPENISQFKREKKK